MHRRNKNGNTHMYVHINLGRTKLASYWNILFQFGDSNFWRRGWRKNNLHSCWTKCNVAAWNNNLETWKNCRNIKCTKSRAKRLGFLFVLKENGAKIKPGER